MLLQICICKQYIAYKYKTSNFYFNLRMIKIKLHLELSPLPRSEYAESPWDYWDFGGNHRVIPSQQTLKGQNQKRETFLE